MVSIAGFQTEISRLPINSEECNFGKWTISYRQSHILASICHNLEKCETDDSVACQFCQYNKALKFPHLPDMVFPNNKLELTYSGGGRIAFSPMEALRGVDTGRPPVQVACAEEWQESRPVLEQKGKSFDWTFTTDYKGTLEGLELTPTEEKIDIEKLKKREQIIFYHDLCLFEDELHDHGIAACTVKIRVMPSSWFVLLRYFLRVDSVMTKIHDTRMFYEVDSPHILMEYTTRGADIPDLKIHPALLIDPNELAQHLPLQSQLLYKIVLPSV